MGSEQQRNVIWARFCALYLPDTVSRYLDLPTLEDGSDPEFAMHYKLWNAYSDVLARIQHTPYFSKYLRSNKPIAAPGKRLPSVIAERLLEAAPHLDRRMRVGTPDRPTHFYQDFTAACVRFLGALLASFVKLPDQEAVVQTATRQGLLPWFKRWDELYGLATSCDVFNDTLSITMSLLSPSDDVRSTARVVRKHLINLHRCALPSCDATGNFKACIK